MWSYDKRLQYPVKIDKPDPQTAKIVISLLGGADGELGASMRYLNQRYAMPYKECKGVLTDIGTAGSFRPPFAPPHGKHPRRRLSRKPKCRRAVRLDDNPFHQCAAKCPAFCSAA